MRRRLTKIGLSLLLLSGGAIVNVAVAWSSLLLPPCSPDVVGTELRSPIEGYLDRCILYRVHLTRYEVRVPAGDAELPALAVCKQGWPMTSLRSRGECRGKWHYSAAASINREPLALQPDMPGFAINTLFYSAILWVMFAGPFAYRRHRRIKRNLCPACAYPIGTSEVCTECGKPVRGMSVEPT